MSKNKEYTLNFEKLTPQTRALLYIAKAVSLPIGYKKHGKNNEYKRTSKPNEIQIITKVAFENVPEKTLYVVENEIDNSVESEGFPVETSNSEQVETEIENSVESEDFPVESSYLDQVETEIENAVESEDFPVETSNSDQVETEIENPVESEGFPVETSNLDQVETELENAVESEDFPVESSYLDQVETEMEDAVEKDPSANDVIDGTEIGNNVEENIVSKYLCNLESLCRNDICIPYLTDEYGRKIPINDINAIATFLINKFKPNHPLYPREPLQRGIIDCRANFNSLRIHVPLVNCVDGDTINTSDIIKIYYDIEGALGNAHTYICGDELTIADLFIMATVYTLKKFKDFEYLADVTKEKLKHFISWYNLVQREACVIQINRKYNEDYLHEEFKHKLGKQN